ncbi:hypothetical protein AB4Z40_08725 [Bosea sp. 2YAB26]|uniref:hypothetical protein n=1 Tax=Bosea sp. 2YAB26 TaxID=3237478 RepID=UPI003F9199D2
MTIVALLMAQPVLSQPLTEIQVDGKMKEALHSFGAAATAKACEKGTDLDDLLQLKVLVDKAEEHFGMSRSSAVGYYKNGQEMVRDLNSQNNGKCLDAGMWIMGWVDALTEAYRLRGLLHAQR